MPLQLKPLHPLFAAEASGIDLTQPVSVQDARAINAAMNQYAVLVWRGQPLSQEQQVRLTGHFGRLDIGAYLREVHRGQGLLGSVYDSNVTTYDPFPYAPQQRASDPILDAIIAPTTSAMVDFVTRTVGWKVDARYEALSYDVGGAWDGGIGNIESVTDLRQSFALDTRIKMLIVHGYDDLSCPYFASRLIVDQMPQMGDPGRIKLRMYPGGHMFYSRPGSQASLRQDVMSLYGVN